MDLLQVPVMDGAFLDQLDSAHRLETNKLRNIGKSPACANAKERGVLASHPKSSPRSLGFVALCLQLAKRIIVDSGASRHGAKAMRTPHRTREPEICFSVALALLVG